MKKLNQNKTQNSTGIAPIVVELSGGLGNQLFQYNFALLLALLSKRNLMLDITSIYRDVQRDPDILKLVPATSSHIEITNTDTIEDIAIAYITTRRKLFSILGKRVLSSLHRFEKIIHKIFPYTEAKSSDSYLFLDEKSTLYQDLMYFQNKKIQKNLSEEQHEMLESLATQDLSIPLFVRGYWQDMRLFCAVRKRKPLCRPSPKQEHTIEDICNELQQDDFAVDFNHACVVHVRRVDLLFTEHPKCSLDYYRQAVKEVRRHDAKAQFLVFSDDVTWCEEHLDIGSPFILIAHNKRKQSKTRLHHAVPHKIYSHNVSAVDELLLMNQCRHFIYSNSSFVWWGTRLLETPNASHNSPNSALPSQIIVAPFPWFEQKKKVSAAIYSKDWKLLHNRTGKPVELKDYWN